MGTRSTQSEPPVSGVRSTCWLECLTGAALTTPAVNIAILN
jgi:hypothetical protein